MECDPDIIDSYDCIAIAPDWKYHTNELPLGPAIAREFLNAPEGCLAGGVVYKMNRNR